MPWPDDGASEGFVRGSDQGEPVNVRKLHELVILLSKHL